MDAPRSDDAWPGLDCATLTGADERTDLGALATLLARYSALEIGLLYTASPECRNRYPSMEWLEGASKLLCGRFALHVCGRAARAEILHDHAPLMSIIDRARRVQVNGDVGHGELPFLAARVPALITRYRPDHTDLRHDPVANHALLVDPSEGHGLSRSRWRRPATVKAVGFAGGLGPENVRDQLRLLAGVAPGPFWIDVEDEVRTNDRFDLGKCQAVLCLVFGEGSAGRV